MPQMSMEEAFSDQLKFQHDVLAQRITWLMTINGFLVGSFTLVMVNQEKMGSLPFGVLIAIATLGAAANSSALFSNWWGTRCIRDISSVLQESWAADDLDTDEKEKRRSLMRLYGRDPASFKGFQRNIPTEWLHPWLFLPAVFTLSFFFAPFILNLVQDSEALVQSMIPFLVIIPFGILVLWDMKYRKQDHMWALAFDPSLQEATAPMEQMDGPTSIVAPTWTDMRDRYKTEKNNVKDWVNRERKGDTFPREHLRRVHFWGIPQSTLAAYRKHLEQTRLPREQPPSHS